MTTLPTLIPLLEPIRPDLEQVVRLLFETTAEVEEPLGAKLRSALGGGKHVRPALVILVGRLFDVPIEPFYKLAAAVEVLHTATLIHDDVVDEAPLRRGRATLHVTWPVGATILAGDYLLAQSASLLADLERPRVLQVFADTLCTLCRGEIRQMFAAQQERISREAYYRRIEAKTASLCAAATDMAGVLAEAGEAHIAALRRFGLELGIAFQIVDDVLDFVGDEARLGKPAGGDLRQGLITLPTLYYLERGEDDVAVRRLLSGQGDAAHVRAAVEAVRASGAVEDALQEARAHARQAQAALSPLPNNAARQTLHDLAEYVVERNR